MEEFNLSSEVGILTISLLVAAGLLRRVNRIHLYSPAHPETS